MNKQLQIRLYIAVVCAAAIAVAGRLGMPGQWDHLWLVAGLVLAGGIITAILSDHDALASFSGMTSAISNIGPCYISVADLMTLHPVVKIVYIFGMLAGRLEILPVLLIFSRKTWR